MVLDATLHCAQLVTRERLLGWHATLFPTGYSGTSKCSSDTALRDITDLVERGVLQKSEAGAQATS